MKYIKTEADYKKIVESIYKLIQSDIKDNSPELDELEILAILVEDYEKKHYPIKLENFVE